MPALHLSSGLAEESLNQIASREMDLFLASGLMRSWLLFREHGEPSLRLPSLCVVQSVSQALFQGASLPEAVQEGFTHRRV